MSVVTKKWELKSKSDSEIYKTFTDFRDVIRWFQMECNIPWTWEVIHTVSLPNGKSKTKILDGKNWESWKTETIEIKEKSKVAQLVEAGFVISKIWTKDIAHRNGFYRVDELTINVDLHIGNLMFRLIAPAYSTMEYVESMIA